MTDFEFAQAWLSACELVLESDDAAWSDKGVIPLYTGAEYDDDHDVE